MKIRVTKMTYTWEVTVTPHYLPQLALEFDRELTMTEVVKAATLAAREYYKE